MPTIEMPSDKGPLQSIPPMIALGICIQKLGGKVTITQADCDAIAGMFVVESLGSNDLILALGSPAERN